MKVIALAGSNSKNPINKHMLLMANSLGARGGIDLLTAAKNRFLFIGADVIGTCTLSEFYNNFNAEFGSTLMEKAQELSAIISTIHQILFLNATKRFY